MEGIEYLLQPELDYRLLFDPDRKAYQRRIWGYIIKFLDLFTISMNRDTNNHLEQPEGTP